MSSSVAKFSRPCPKNGYYDVFLSFRGKDTRVGFTYNLYNSLMDNQVYTFMDVKLVGKAIDTLFKIIERSKMAVVVYSENFASSDWCLRELDMILQRTKDEKMMMIPIFYKVKPDELKHLTGNTGIYLEQLIPKHGQTNVHKWKTAVTTLGYVSGLHYENSYERVFIAEVIKTAKEMLEEWEEPVGSSIYPHYTALAIEQMTLDEKKESTWNQQAHVSLPKKEDTQTLAAQTNSFPHTTEVPSFFATASFQKVQEITGELLIIKPAGLMFLVTPKKPSYAALILSNKTDNYVAFRLTTDYRLKVSANPRMGVLLPRSSSKVIVTLEADSMQPMECSLPASVQSTKAKNYSYSTDDISNMFAEESGNAIDTCWMCVLIYASEKYPNYNGQQKPDNVMSIDVHPTKPWLLLSMFNNFLSGNVCIWNYETRAEEKSFRIGNDSIGNAKFIPEKHWIVVGSITGFVHVYNYNTSNKVKEFKAHEDFIQCIAVHPTSPYVLTASNDKLVKIWNWEIDWMCGGFFEGHLKPVIYVTFNPKDSKSFTSASHDGTIKIWNFDSSSAKFTINASARELTCVEYFVGNGNKLYLLSGGCDHSVKVWDYESKTLVQTLEGHTYYISTIFVHPYLSIIITASGDQTIRIWNKNTYRLEAAYAGGPVWSFKYINTSDEIAYGYDDGMSVVKIFNANGSGEQQQLASRSASSSSYGTAI